MRGSNSPVVERSHANSSPRSCDETDSSMVDLRVEEVVGDVVGDVLTILPAFGANTWSFRCCCRPWTEGSRVRAMAIILAHKSSGAGSDWSFRLGLLDTVPRSLGLER